MSAHLDSTRVANPRHSLGYPVKSGNSGWMVWTMSHQSNDPGKYWSEDAANYSHEKENIRLQYGDRFISYEITENGDKRENSKKARDIGIVIL